MARWSACALALLVALTVTAPARASYQGRNGLIAFEEGYDDCNFRAVVPLYGADCTGFESSGIRLVAPGGSERRFLKNAFSVIFAPGGRYIGSVGQRGLYVSTIYGRRHRVTRDESDALAGWSPDARSLVFTRNGQVWTVGRRGKRAHAVVPGDEPAWSPSGDEIAFVGCPSDSDTCSGVGIVAPDGSGQRQLAPTGTAPSWSRNGRRVAFVDHGRVKTVDLRGHVRVLRRGSAPRWSPDGRLIAFERRGGGSFERLAVMRPDGSRARPVTGRIAGSYTWSPDSRFLAYSRLTGGYGEELDIVSRRGGPSRKVASPVRAIDDVIDGIDWQGLR